MNVNHGIPLIETHLFEGLVSQYPGVVDQNVNGPVVRDCCIDDGLCTRAVRDRVFVSDGFTACGANFLDNRVSSIALTCTVNATTKIIYHHFSARRG